MNIVLKETTSGWSVLCCYWHTAWLAAHNTWSNGFSVIKYCLLARTGNSDHLCHHPVRMRLETWQWCLEISWLLSSTMSWPSRTHLIPSFRPRSSICSHHIHSNQEWHCGALQPDTWCYMPRSFCLSGNNCTAWGWSLAELEKSWWRNSDERWNAMKHRNVKMFLIFF